MTTLDGTPQRRHAPTAVVGAGGRWVLPLICAAQLLLQLDFSIVNVALPTMQTDLGFTPATLQWVVTGYGLAFGSLLLFGGRLGDIVGHRRTILLGLSVFAVSSLTGGLAVEPVMLIVSRVVQGASAALVAPGVLAVLTGTYTSDASRARALGVFQAASAGGATLGVVLGGVLVQLLGWRAVLLVNPPIIAVLVLLMLWRLPATAPRPGRRDIDVAGAVLTTGAVAALVYAMSSGQEHGFDSPLTLTLLAVAVAAAVAFVLVESRITGPMLPLELLRDRTRAGALAVSLIAGMVVVSYVYFATLYLQQAMALDPLTTGMALIPSTVVVMAVSILLTRRLLPRLGARIMLPIGFTVMAAGQLWLAHLPEHGSYALNVLPGLVLTAAGMGLSTPAAALAANTNVPTHLRGLAGGLFATGQQIGAAIGLAALATIAASRSARPGVKIVGVVDGYRLAYLIAAIAALAAAILAFTVLPRRRATPLSVEAVEAEVEAQH